MVLSERVKNIVFVAEGGLGRVIASTAVLAQIKKKYPDKRIIVVTGFPDIFLYNPAVHRMYNFSNPLNFYDDFMNDETFIMHVEPYRTYGYLNNRDHLIKAWCEMLGLDYDGAQPKLYFLKNEREGARLYVDKLTEGFKKKLVLFQWIGGQIPEDKSPEKLIDKLSRMHKRSLPFQTAQVITNTLISKGYTVGVVQHEHFQLPEGAKLMQFPLRNLLSLIEHAEGFIGIDSFLQHAAAAVGKKGVVLWGGTDPDRLGYEMHVNLNKVASGKTSCLTPNCHRPNSYIFDTNPAGQMWNCPHDEICMEYDIQEVMDAFDNLYKEPVTAEVVPVPVEQPQS